MSKAKHIMSKPKSKKFDMEEIKRQIELIKEAAKVKDHDKAHYLEDILYTQFISFVAAEYQGEIAEMAKEILSTEFIDFCRYYS